MSDHSGSIYYKCKLLFCTFLVFAAALLPLSGCSRKAEPVSRTDFMFDTVVTLTLYDPADESLLGEALAYCRSFEQIFSRTNSESELYRINHRQPGERTLQLSDDLSSAISSALAWAHLSDGALDISMGRVVSLWDFQGEDPKPPSSEEVRLALQSSGWDRLRLEGNMLTFPNDTMELDLGAVAKGYIADRLKDWLKQRGVASALINLGGNLLCLGSQPDGAPFHLGIQKPFGTVSELAGTCAVKDQSMVTSGTYQRHFTSMGVTYHHLLNPETGWPSENGLVSVTILTSSSADADALSTACFILGKEKGMALIESLPDTEAVFIGENSETTASSGWPGQMR